MRSWEMEVSRWEYNLEDTLADLRTSGNLIIWQYVLGKVNDESCLIGYPFVKLFHWDAFQFVTLSASIWGAYEEPFQNIVMGDLPCQKFGTWWLLFHFVGNSCFARKGSLASRVANFSKYSIVRSFPFHVGHRCPHDHRNINYLCMRTH